MKEQLDALFSEITSRYRKVFKTPPTVLDKKNDRLSVECNHGDMNAIGRLAMGRN